MKPRLKVFPPNDPQLVEYLPLIKQLRFLVWQEIVGVRLAQERFSNDGCDERSVHFLFEVGHEIVAAARLTMCFDFSEIPDGISFSGQKEKMNFPLAIMSRMVIAEQYRGYGLSEQLTELRIKTAQQELMSEIWVESSDRRFSQVCEKFAFNIEAQSPDTSVPGKWWLLRKILIG